VSRSSCARIWRIQILRFVVGRVKRTRLVLCPRLASDSTSASSRALSPRSSSDVITRSASALMMKTSRSGSVRV
jgi:hypothetical protein